jgi:CheY-like chemotaxis protein/bifunctional DNA-binding transcriptional regulator/antitoxin component of YhaV-PrlF toxin-antitoxin module
LKKDIRIKYICKLCDKLHFNRKRVIGSNQNSVNDNNSIDQNFLLIDNLKVDDHSRITFTKRIRNIFAIETGDMIEVSQNLKNNNNIIFIVKRRDAVIDSWICKKITGKEVDNESDTDFYIDDNAFHTTPALSGSMLGPNEVPSYHLTNITQTDIIERNSSSFDNNTTTYTTGTTRRPDNNTSMKTIPKVMIVDDDEDMLLTFKTILNDNGIHAETFANSPEALICFAEAEPSYFNLVILDIKMQDINGFQLYKIMKALTRGTSATTKFLFISALEYAEESIRLLPGIKPKDILKKPIQREKLVAKINEILAIK